MKEKKPKKRVGLQTRANEVLKKKKKEETVLPVPSLPVCSGTILTVGQGDIGQLGLGPDVLEKSRPTVVQIKELIVDIAAGGMHTVCLTESGQVFTFGCNDECALGRDTTDENEQMKPGKVNLQERIVRISAGDSHSAALGASGNLFVWGNFRDSSGSMGLTLRGPQPLPVQLMAGIPVVQIASGSDHLICLSEQGTLYSFGNGEQGQLGRIPPYYINRGGRRGLGLFLSPEPVRLGRKTAPIEFDCIWTSSYSSFAREKKTGNIYGFGLNNYNQLGFSDSELRYQPERIEAYNGKKWKIINGGQHHTLALDEAGQVYALGRKDYGRLGLGEDTDDKAQPTAIPALRDEQIVHIACGNVVSFAVSRKGTIFSWGMGTNEQLGHGNDEDVFIPKMIGGKALLSKKVIKVSGGGQHTVILAAEASTRS